MFDKKDFVDECHDQLRSIDREMAEELYVAGIQSFTELSEALAAPPFEEYDRINYDHDTLKSMARDLHDMGDRALASDIRIILSDSYTVRDIHSQEYDETLVVIEPADAFDTEDSIAQLEMFGLEEAAARDLVENESIRRPQELAILGEDDVNSLRYGSFDDRILSNLEADGLREYDETYSAFGAYDIGTEGSAEVTETEQRMIVHLEQQYDTVEEGLEELATDPYETIKTLLLEGTLEEETFALLMDQTMASIDASPVYDARDTSTGAEDVQEDVEQSLEGKVPCPVDGCSMQIDEDHLYDHCLDEHGFWDESFEGVITDV